MAFKLNVWISGWSTKNAALSQQVLSEIVAKMLYIKFILHHRLLPHNHGTDVQLWERQIVLHCTESKEEEVCLTCQHTPTPNEQIVCMLQTAKICKGKRGYTRDYVNNDPVTLLFFFFFFNEIFSFAIITYMYFPVFGMSKQKAKGL